MRTLLRTVAVAIAVMAVVDPVVARRTAAPVPLDVHLPRPSDPEHSRALAVRGALASALDGRAVLDGWETPRAIVAIGRASLPSSMDAPIFIVPLAARPGVSIQEAHAPAAVPGQSVPIAATLRGVGLAGRTTSIRLERSGMAVDTIDHAWTTGDETFVARLGFVSAAAGLHRVRISAATPGLDAATAADLAIVSRDRRLRVLAYERRPSWPLAFVRRSLESDPLLDVAATVRTTNRSATISGAPASLAAVQLDRFDAILVGAPETLTEADAGALAAFVSRRGGSVVLLPDRRITASVRGRFDLPVLEEVVLEDPVTTAPPGPALRASELLLTPQAPRAIDPLRVVRHGGRDRGLVVSMISGEGRIVLSGALDAWRYRAVPEAAFDLFWRGLVADAAAAAPARLTVTAEPSVARPGEDVLVSAAVRPTEFAPGGSVTAIPPVTARLSGAGRDTAIRLWPETRPGRFSGRIQAPAAGAYSVSASIPGASADTPLLIAGDIVRAVREASGAAAFAASSSGGAVVSDVEDLAARIGALESVEVERRSRPMRSPWWMVPFAGVLCAEWALRRRGGLR